MKQYIKIMVLLAFFAMNAGCESWLDVQPVDSVSEEQLFETESGFMQALNGVYVEMNNASLNPHGYRGDAKARDAELLKLCKEKRVYVSLGSDSHGAAHIGDFTYSLALVRECAFPEELIVNTSIPLFLSLLEPHREARKNYNK